MGRKTLNAAMIQMGVKELPNGKIRQAFHGFGDSKSKKKPIAAVVVPFRLCTIDNKKVEFKICFDVIEGELPFLIGFPSLESMDATVTCRNKILSITVNKCIYRIQMIYMKFDCGKLMKLHQQLRHGSMSEMSTWL